MPDTSTTVEALRPDPENRRTHDARNLGMVAQALTEVGPARSIVIDEGDVILAGNGVVAAARDAGITRVRIIEADGEELIAVRRRNLTPEQKRALAIYDNRTAELAAWNFDQLAQDRAGGLDLRPYWTEGEEAMLLGKAVDPTWDGMPEFDQQDALAWRTLKIHFANADDFAAFCRLLQRDDLTEKTRAIWYPKDEREKAVSKVRYAATAGGDDDD